MKHTAIVLQILALILQWVPSVYAEPLRVGYIGSLSGDSAIIGQEILRSLQVVFDQTNRDGGINGRPIELIVQDDGYNVSKALLGYEKIKGTVNTHAIFMSTYGALFALGKRPLLDGTVVVDTLDCNDSLVKTSPMHTCVATRTESIADGFVRAIKKQGGGKVGILFEDEAWFSFIVASLREKLDDKPLEITAPTMSSDYKGEILKLKANQVDQLIFLGNDSMGNAMAEARRAGMSSHFYSIAGVMSPEFRELAGAALEGTIVSNWNVPTSKQYTDFQNSFITLHKEPICLASFAGPTADAASLLVKVLKEDSTLTSTELRRKLASYPRFEGISGPIKMDDDGAVRTILETTFRFVHGKLEQDIEANNSKN